MFCFEAFLDFVPLKSWLRILIALYFLAENIDLAWISSSSDDE